jgi:hypothetical protein
MNQRAYSHHLRIIFKDKDGHPYANSKYMVSQNGKTIQGVTDAKGQSELLKSDQADPVEIWVVDGRANPVPVGKTVLLSVDKKPYVVAHRLEKPKNVDGQTKDNNPVESVPAGRYSVQFNVEKLLLPLEHGKRKTKPPFNCSGHVSYRIVQDGKVLTEGTTRGETKRTYTDSESEVSLYIAGDKRYKAGEAYKQEVNADKSAIPAWKTAKPKTDHGYVENEHAFEDIDWVDVSKIYDEHHPDVTPQSQGIYAGKWTPMPEEDDDVKQRSYVTQVGKKEVTLTWIEDACDNGVYTPGRNTFKTKKEHDRYMTVEQVINRTHPKVFKVLFEVIEKLELTKVEISSSWRPGKGSSAHREGRGLDITSVDTVEARDNLPGTHDKDDKDTPTTTEPELIKKLREALYNHPEVIELFDPWYGMFPREKNEKGTFKASYVLQNVTKPKPGESDDAFQKRKAAADKADKESGVASHESGTFAEHRNHLHFDISLD